jgi:methionyl-tRNA formyltransferase
MKKMSETIVFFGSGPVAAASLRLLAQDFEIEAVITRPRAAQHKGSVPVIEAAEDLAVPILTATDKQSLDTLFASKPVKSHVAVLIDFGIIVSQNVIDYFPLGIVNSHFSILPQWRGADPITFSILSGQQKTGISLMLLVAAMDEGPLLAYSGYDLSPDITTPQLTEDLIDLSYQTLHVILPKYIDGECQPTSQDITGEMPSYSRKLTKEDSLLDWQKPAVVLEREIRAFIEWPRSRTTIGGLELIITKAHVVPENDTPGTPFVADKHPGVYCSQGALLFERLKPAGKQEMTGEGFLAGYKNIFLGTTS